MPVWKCLIEKLIISRLIEHPGYIFKLLKICLLIVKLSNVDINFIELYVLFANSICTLLDTFMKKKNKKLTSPTPSSIHSKHSSMEPQSPIDKVLSDIFSPASNPTDQGFASLFGGPAVNVEGVSFYPFYKELSK